MQQKRTIIHVAKNPTAEVGEIGDFFAGLLTSDSYKQHTERTLIIGPLDGDNKERLNGLGKDCEIFYSSLENITQEPYRRTFAELEENFGMSIVYGRKKITNPVTGREAQAEIILIDPKDATPNPVNAFKAWLYDDFGIESSRYEHDPEYERYVKIAPAAVSALRALSVSSPQQPAILIAHDYSAMPTVLAGIMDPLGSFKTVFYGHQLDPIRNIVENHPGHDTMFLNIQEWAIKHRYYFDEVFGTQNHCFKYALLNAAANCDNVIADSEHVLRQLQFLGPQFDTNHCDLAYCGINAEQITVQQKNESKQKLQQYAQNLLNFKPDYIFSHIAKMSTAKALWRDLGLLHHLDQAFQKDNCKGVFFLLSTDASQRSAQKIRSMEQQWNWPVNHRSLRDDLTAAEDMFYQNIEYFNGCHENIKIVFVNQYGWNQRLCGERMPHDMEMSDLRKGADAEFSQSIYEPFGITPLKSISYGTICVTSSACACNDFVMSLTGADLCDNLLIGDYTNLDRRLNTAKSLLGIDQAYRDTVECGVARQLAQQLYQRLPRSQAQQEKLLQTGNQLARQMSWEKVCENFFMPALEQAYHHRRTRQIA